MYKFGIIGCGRIAPRHAEQIKKAGNLVAVCDIDKDRADAFAKEYNSKAYYTIDDLLKEAKEIDIISICTPNGFHAEHAIKSLQAGKNVLCEKPLCITGAAAWQLIETEKFSRKKLFVVKSTRYNPLLKDLKSLIQNNKLGEIYNFQLSCFWNRPAEYYEDWHGTIFPDGGTLYTQFSHYIDALLWLLGDIESVKGFAANKALKNIIEFEDTGVASMYMQSGVLGTINWSVNSYKKNYGISLALLAEKGTIIIGGEYLNELVYKQLEFEFEFSSQPSQPNDYNFYKGSMSNHSEVYENLFQALNNPSHPFTNAFDGLKTVEAIEKIYKAVNPIMQE
jgi:UDP-N-acetyl-2-amino-2-deoxyglucuronate dehydrogenase